MFADVVGALARDGWSVVTVEEEANRARGINTPAELLSLACGLAAWPAGHAELGWMCHTLADMYHLETRGLDSPHALRAAIESHQGPIHFFRRWEAYWA
jgi:hypothetical protein